MYRNRGLTGKKEIRSFEVVDWHEFTFNFELTIMPWELSLAKVTVNLDV